jgi:hydrogenase maturation protease
MSRAEVVVIGVGNVVLSDDGLGVHAVRRLRDRYALGDEVELIEGCTAGLLLLPSLADARCAVLIDAIDVGAEPGTLVRLEGEDWQSAFASGLTAHDVALADLLAAAQLSGAWPERLVLHGVQPQDTDLGTELTPLVARALDPLLEVVRAELDGWLSERRPGMESATCA